MRSLLLLSAILLFSNCKNRPAAVPASEVTASESGTPPPAGFLDFYEKFHRDSLFQMAHIQFPLTGEKSVMSEDSTSMTKGPIQWHPETWDMHHPIDLEQGGYQREMQVLGDALVIERVREKVSGYFIERRFAKIADDWTLIYYADF